MKIKAIITGTTGMVGKALLLECLENNKVESVLVINRHSINLKHPKLKEIIHKDFFDLSTIQDKFKNYNTCYFCLGVSAFRMSEADYTKITHDLTLNFAQSILDVNQNMTFCYVSGAGTDSTEKGKTMWARVKGKTENDLLKMPFQNVYMFRPAFIYPEKGVQTRTKIYKIMIPIVKLLYPIVKRFPKYSTTSSQLGQAMIKVVYRHMEKKHFESEDINQVV